MLEVYLVYKITKVDDEIEQVDIYTKTYSQLDVAFSDSIIRKYYNKRNASVISERSANAELEKEGVCNVAMRTFKDVDDETEEVTITNELVYIKKLNIISV